jgi:hypothetical protein
VPVWSAVPRVFVAIIVAFMRPEFVPSGSDVVLSRCLWRRGSRWIPAPVATWEDVFDTPRILHRVWELPGRRRGQGRQLRRGWQQGHVIHPGEHVSSSADSAHPGNEVPECCCWPRSDTEECYSSLELGHLLVCDEVLTAQDRNDVLHSPKGRESNGHGNQLCRDLGAPLQSEDALALSVNMVVDRRKCVVGDAQAPWISIAQRVPADVLVLVRTINVAQRVALDELLQGGVVRPETVVHQEGFGIKAAGGEAQISAGG